MANAQRQYESFQVFNARVVDMRHLWEPSREYKGQQQQKPNFFATIIVPKTQAHWSTEPIFGGMMQAFGKLLSGQFSAFQQNPGAAGWPVVDGDMPNPETGKQSEFAVRHWLLTGSSGNMPTVEMVQAGGQLVKLQNRVGVKPGDFSMCGFTAAVSKQDARRIKLYLNAVVFTNPGEEIVFANSVSGAEMMKAAEAQGFRPQGYAPAAGGFGGAGGFTPVPQGGDFSPGGFAPAPAQNGFGGAPQGPSGQFGGAPGFQPQTGPGNGGGFAPTQGGPAFQGGAGVAPGTNGPGNGFVSPSNPNPGGWPGR
jgi:hypothetical protein